VKVTIILDFVDEVGLDYQASKLRHTINVKISPTGNRWEPDSCHGHTGSSTGLATWLWVNCINGIKGDNNTVCKVFVCF
jgi:hypothetical protein